MLKTNFKLVLPEDAQALLILKEIAMKVGESNLNPK
jgi:hypothetical protein